MQSPEGISLGWFSRMAQAGVQSNLVVFHRSTRLYFKEVYTSRHVENMLRMGYNMSCVVSFVWYWLDDLIVILFHFQVVQKLSVALPHLNGSKMMSKNMLRYLSLSSQTFYRSSPFTNLYMKKPDTIRIAK